MTTARNAHVLWTMPLLIVVCLLSIPTEAETSRYKFPAEQSTLVQTGGIAGIDRTYTITGTFELTADFETCTALFSQVDASAACSIPSRSGEEHYSLDPNEVFNMTELDGRITDVNSIRFEGMADDGSSIQITLTLADGNVSLKGETVPPPGSADFFIYTMDALAEPKYEYSGGTGEPNDPYLIATAEDLIALGENPEDYDKHFILTADIDLDPNLPGRKVFGKAVIAPDTNDVEYSFQGTTFSGSFDGNSHVISHLMIEGQSYLGLFGQLVPRAKISNLGLEAVDVNGTGKYVGGLVGKIGSWEIRGGVLANCYSTGTVIGAKVVGGLVGDNFGSITTSYSTCTVRGEWCVGGLMGGNGLSDYPMGGGFLTNCYSKSMVDGEDFVGGLVGENNGTIDTSYITGMVTGGKTVGGLVGDNFGSIVTSYSIGIVMGRERVGGLVGWNDWGSSTASFWDIEISGQTTSAGGTGLTTAEMKDINIFLSKGWDFVDETLNGTSDYWQIPSGDYPRLRYHFGDSPMMPEGKGTSHEPYLIRDVRDLGTVWFKPSAHYRLEASLDLSGITWSMAVVPWFEGTFDGNGYVISKLHIQGGGHMGLFGRLGSGAKISNLGLEAVEVNGIGDRIGALVGDNSGSIATSYSTGTVTGSREVGGLVGNNWEGSIATSYSTVTVTGNWEVGGLVGHNFGSTTMSYSSGTVTGNIHVGGLVGYNRGIITTRYSSGSITTSYSSSAVSGNIGVGGLVGSNDRGNITTSFWDVETSGQPNSDGGTGLTTAEMQTASTFLESGWDFVDETANGTEDIWWILEDQDYPRLWWELIPEN